MAQTPADAEHTPKVCTKDSAPRSAPIETRLCKCQDSCCMSSRTTTVPNTMNRRWSFVLSWICWLIVCH